MERVSIGQIKKEIKIATARSSGPGGQHANKVETKVILRFNILESKLLTDNQNEILKAAHKNKLNKEGELIVIADSKRSQLKNKVIAFKKMDRLLAKAFIKRKPRKQTQPTKASKRKRLTDKKMQSEKKKLRQKLQ